MQMDITAFLGNQRKIILVIFGLLALVLLGLGDYLATAKFGKKVMHFLQQRRYIAVVWMARYSSMASVLSRVTTSK
jgi:hypothetical protein